jgi:hypothetical protein
MYFFQGNRSTGKKAGGSAAKSSFLAQDANDDSKTIQKRLSQGTTYSYFGIGKKQMPGVETTVGDRGS